MRVAHVGVPPSGGISVFTANRLKAGLQHAAIQKKPNRLPLSAWERAGVRVSTPHG